MPKEHPTTFRAQSDQQPLEGVVTYAGTFSLSNTMTGKDALLVIALMTVVIGAMVLMLSFAPGPHSSLVFPDELIGSIWVFTVLVVLLPATPWQLTLNYGEKTYTFVYGYRLTRIRRTGPFADISGVSCYASNRLYSIYKHVICLRFAKGTTTRNICLETGLDADAGAERAQALAVALSTAVVDMYGKPADLNSPQPTFGDQATFSNASTSYGRNRYKNCVALIIIFVLGIASAYPLSAFTSPGGSAKGISMVIVMSIFCGWPIPILYIQANPWKLSLDFSTKRYRLQTGFRPFALIRTGRFDDIVGVRVIELGSLSDSQAYAISIMFRSLPRHTPFMLESVSTRATADERAGKFATMLHATVVNASGDPISSAATLKLDEPIVTYTQDSIPDRVPRKRRLAEAGFEALFALVCCPRIFWSPYVLHRVGPATYLTSCFGCAFLIYYNIQRAWPWRLTLDYMNEKVELISGWLPFGFRLTGTFNRVDGITVVPLLHGIFNEPYQISMSIATRFGRKSYLIETASTSSEADARAAHLASRLGVGILPPG